MNEERVPVLVVGAGLSGLSAAMFLGVHGIRTIVVERHATTSIYPKARGQFPHTMEALRVAADGIYQGDFALIALARM